MVTLFEFMNWQFSISPPETPISQRAAGDLPVATNIDVFGTKTETITLDNPKNIAASMRKSQ